MTNTTEVPDTVLATEALVAKYGSFVLLGARSNPFGATNTVLTAVGEPLAHPSEVVPNFRLALSVQDVVAEVGVAEVGVFIDERPRWRKDDPAVQNALGALQAELGTPEFAEAFAAAESLTDDVVGPWATAVPENYYKFSIMQLRKASRGVVKGGYGLPKTDLIAALIAVGLSPLDVEKVGTV